MTAWAAWPRATTSWPASRGLRGRCQDPCRAGNPEFSLTAFLGMVGRDPLAPPHGGFGTAPLALDATRLIRVTEGLAEAQAAMIEPTTVALQHDCSTQQRACASGPRSSCRGVDPIGLLTLQCARAEGADHLIAVEPDAGRRALAQAPSAPTRRSRRPRRPRPWLVHLRTWSSSPPGAPPAIQAAVDLVGRGGRVNLVGVSGAATIQPKAWTVKEVSVKWLARPTSTTSSPSAMDLIASGHVRVEPLHDATVPLERAAETFAALADDRARGEDPRRPPLTAPRPRPLAQTFR